MYKASGWLKLAQENVANKQERFCSAVELSINLEKSICWTNWSIQRHASFSIIVIYVFFFLIKLNNNNDKLDTENCWFWCAGGEPAGRVSGQEPGRAGHALPQRGREHEHLGGGGRRGQPCPPQGLVHQVGTAVKGHSFPVRNPCIALSMTKKGPKWATNAILVPCFVIWRR